MHFNFQYSWNLIGSGIKIFKDLSKFEVLYGQALWQSAIRFSDNDVTASAWCHGNNDFLQVDQKTMFNYTDYGSAQNRFCGTSLPRIGGIDNNNVYVSEENQLILWLKTNGDTNIGVFHLHFLFQPFV